MFKIDEGTTYSLPGKSMSSACLVQKTSKQYRTWYHRFATFSQTYTSHFSFLSPTGPTWPWSTHSFCLQLPYRKYFSLSGSVKSWLLLSQLFPTMLRTPTMHFIYLTLLDFILLILDIAFCSPWTFSPCTKLLLTTVDCKHWPISWMSATSKNPPRVRLQDSLNWYSPWTPSPLTTNTIIKLVGLHLGSKMGPNYAYLFVGYVEKQIRDNTQAWHHSYTRDT